jgi:hypothetical protein
MTITLEEIRDAILAQREDAQRPGSVELVNEDREGGRHRSRAQVVEQIAVVATRVPGTSEIDELLHTRGKLIGPLVKHPVRLCRVGEFLEWRHIPVIYALRALIIPDGHLAAARAVHILPGLPHTIAV